jgi:hypothetical protein
MTSMGPWPPGASIGLAELSGKAGDANQTVVGDRGGSGGALSLCGELKLDHVYEIASKRGHLAHLFNPFLGGRAS